MADPPFDLRGLKLSAVNPVYNERATIWHILRFSLPRPRWREPNAK